MASAVALKQPQIRGRLGTLPATADLRSWVLKYLDCRSPSSNP